MRRFGCSTLMAWVACLLTFGASGDDINLLRLVLPSLASPTSDPLPLDDPNTDFTLPVKLTLTNFKHHHLAPAVWSGDARPALWRIQTDPLPILTDLSTSVDRQLPSSHPPLRC
jgi:hypothetical protein